jgi:hypothetical protein
MDRSSTRNAVKVWPNSFNKVSVHMAYVNRVAGFGRATKSLRSINFAVYRVPQ